MHLAHRAPALGARVCATSLLPASPHTNTARCATNLPDYNTSVNIHEHKLKRPDKPPPRWKGLEGLKERTKVLTGQMGQYLASLFSRQGNHTGRVKSNINSVK